MNVKKHLGGGTLRRVIATEVQRVMFKYAGESMPYEKASLELGVAPRTLRIWTAPVEKGGWDELQGIRGSLGIVGSMEKLIQTEPGITKRKKKKKARKLSKV